MRISISVNIESKNIKEKKYIRIIKKNIILQILQDIKIIFFWYFFFVNSHWKNGYTQVQYKRGRLQDHGNSGAEDGTS